MYVTSQSQQNFSQTQWVKQYVWSWGLVDTFSCSLRKRSYNKNEKNLQNDKKSQITLNLIFFYVINTI